MPLLVSLARFVGIILLEFVAFFLFYNHPYGRKAVYRAPYAWVIDLLAIVSGALLISWSVYALSNPGLFTADVPDGIFWAIFFTGSWQALIHASKWLIRLLR